MWVYKSLYDNIQTFQIEYQSIVLTSGGTTIWPKIPQYEDSLFAGFFIFSMQRLLGHFFLIPGSVSIPHIFFKLCLNVCVSLRAAPLGLF